MGLASVPSKMVAKVCRKHLVVVLEALSREYQLGALKGGGTDLCSIYVRSFRQLLRGSKTSGSMAFFDLTAAFYTALPRWIFGDYLPAHIASLLYSTLGWDEQHA